MKTRMKERIYGCRPFCFGFERAQLAGLGTVSSVIFSSRNGRLEGPRGLEQIEL